MNESSVLPTRQGIEAAAIALQGIVPETPLYRSEGLSSLLGAEVWLKNEAASPIGSFKLRGAYTELSRARAKGQLSGAVTASTGNHGQGVAYAARLLGVPAHIFLPEGANPLKRERIAAMGAQLHEGGGDIDQAKARARDFCAREGLWFVDDGESLAVLEGAGTVGLEIARRVPGLERVYVPMGSGSLAGGIGCVFEGAEPRVRVTAVAAERSPAMADSFRARAPLERPVHSRAEGLACREPAHLALQALLAFVDDVAQVSDEALLSAVGTLATYAQVLAEPSGAAGWAAMYRERAALGGRRVALVLTGANVTVDTLRAALA